MPAVPQWAWALIVMVVLTATNLVSVGSYGEFEFWFAGIKVVAIAAFIVIGGLAVFGVLPGSDNPAAGPRATSPSTAASCRTAPARSSPVCCMVVFSFMGSEIVTLAAGESENPQRAVTKATNSVIWRIARLLPRLDLRRGDPAAVERHVDRQEGLATSRPWTRSASRTPARS